MEIGGGTLIVHSYNSSLYHLLCKIFPEIDWLPWKFERAVKNYWEDENIQKKFIKYATEKFNIRNPSDWYNVTYKQMQEIGGATLLEKYGSLANLLSSMNPDFNFLPWKQEKAPTGYWNDLKNQRKFMDWAATELKITNLDEWNNVSKMVTMATN
jgi:hypothetical protein